jgi:ATP-dependent Lon protease
MQLISDKKKASKKQQQQQKKNKLKKNRPDSDDDDSDLELSEDEESASSDSEYKPKKHATRASKKKQVVESDDDEEEEEEEVWEDDDGDEDEAEEEEDEEKTFGKFQKFISKMFPSQYAKEKANSKSKPVKSKSKPVKSKSKSKPVKTKSKRIIEEESDDDDVDDEEDEDEEDEDEEDVEEDEEEDEYEPDEDELAEEQKGFYSIVFNVDGESEEYVDEDEDVECDSDDEAAFMKEKYERVDALHDVVPAETKKAKKALQAKKDAKAKKAAAAKADDASDLTDVEQEYTELLETKKTLTNQLKKKPTSKILKNAVKECDATIKELIKKARSKNAKTYHELVHGGKKNTNEMDYFKKKLSNKEQLRVMKDLKEINSYINIEKPYRLTLLDSPMPAKFKAIALQKLNVLKSMDPGDNEYYKIKNWVDTFMRIPFGIHKSLTVRMEDGMEKCQEFMESAKNHLDSCVYGLDDAKMQIMQMIGQWIANPSAMGTAIAIKGPPGTGKTSLVKEGISKILGREFTFIALGGTGDASFLEGHSYTYEGSTWGKIVQILIDSKCMNPVIYFDELDKISDTARGQEIVGILTHLTDTSQNTQFHDKYFSEVEFDLSKCLFIFSYNDESMVNPILRDRMYRIQTSGYDSKQKTVIARNYMLPKICEQVNFKEGDIIIPDETIQYIVSNKALTGDEAGVRNLKRCFEIIHTKLNLFRLMKPNAKVFGKEMEMKVEFPFTVTKKEVDILIKNEEKQNQSMLAMYC